MRYRRIAVCLFLAPEESAAGLACAGQTVTVADGNQTTPWTFSELNGAPPRITQRRTQAVPNGRVCQRVLSAVSRVVIDVVACGTSITNEAGQVAEQMAAKVTP